MLRMAPDRDTKEIPSSDAETDRMEGVDERESQLEQLASTKTASTAELLSAPTATSSTEPSSTSSNNSVFSNTANNNDKKRSLEATDEVRNREGSDDTHKRVKMEENGNIEHDEDSAAQEAVADEVEGKENEEKKDEEEDEEEGGHEAEDEEDEEDEEEAEGEEDEEEKDAEEAREFEKNDKTFQSIMISDDKCSLDSSVFSSCSLKRSFDESNCSDFDDEVGRTTEDKLHQMTELCEFQSKEIEQLNEEVRRLKRFKSQKRAALIGAAGGAAATLTALYQIGSRMNL